jgi:hypothetical protein
MTAMLLIRNAISVWGVDMEKKGLFCPICGHEFAGFGVYYINANGFLETVCPSCKRTITFRENEITEYQYNFLDDVK